MAGISPAFCCHIKMFYDFGIFFRIVFSKKKNRNKNPIINIFCRIRFYTEIELSKHILVIMRNCLC